MAAGSAALAALATLSVTSGSLVAQGGATTSASSNVAPYAAPRTSDGQPDISGMWLPGALPAVETPTDEPWRGERYAASSEFSLTGGGGGGGRGGGPAPERRPAVVDPPDGKIPLQPWAVEKRDEIIAHQDDPKWLDNRALCLPSGTPRMQSPISYNTYQILQRPGYVVILYEYDHNYRVIPLDGRPHLHPNIRHALGDPRGHWEGNTLVVDSTNFSTNLPNNTWVTGQGQPPWGAPGHSLSSGHGVFYSDALHVVERFTRTAADTIRYEATIDDPKVLTRPFTIAYDAFKAAPKGHQLFEYACHEGNQKAIFLMTGVDMDKIYAEIAAEMAKIYDAK